MTDENVPVLPRLRGENGGRPGFGGNAVLFTATAGDTGRRVRCGSDGAGVGLLAQGRSAPSADGTLGPTLTLTSHAAHLVVESAVIVCASLSERGENRSYDFQLAFE